MSSGVAVDEKCLSDYQSLKLGHKFKYIIYNLNKENTKIVVEKTGNGNYDDFISDLPETECRWAVYDFDYKHDGGDRSKLTFYTWAPDNAKIKNKMLFASSKDALRRALVGIATEVQGTDYDEVSHEHVLEKVARNY